MNSGVHICNQIMININNNSGTATIFDHVALFSQSLNYNTEQSEYFTELWGSQQPSSDGLEPINSADVCQ